MSRVFSIIALLTISRMVCCAQDSLTTPKFSKAVFGIKAGLNISHFSTSINSEFRSKGGLALGIYMKKQIGRRVYFRPELYYSNQGQKTNYLYPYGGPSVGSTTTNMHYINIPCLLEVGSKVSFQVGAQLGLLITGTEKGTVASTKVDENLNDVMTTADLSVVVGAGFSPIEHFNCGIRINYGVTNIYTPQDQKTSNIDVPNIQNRVIHFYVAYSF